MSVPLATKNIHMMQTIAMDDSFFNAAVFSNEDDIVDTTPCNN